MKHLRVMASLVVSLALGNIAAYHENKSRLEDYVEENLSAIISQQETNFGITYKTSPEVVIGKDEKIKYSHSGSYDHLKEKIYLSPLLYINDDSISRTIAKIITFGLTAEIKETLDHELGHHYVAQVKKDLGIRADLFFIFGIPELALSSKIVSEGIAMYFEGKMNHLKNNYGEWPEHPLDWNTRDIYFGGHKLVKPILDVNLREGIEYLILNPPLDLTNLEDYQRRALEAVVE